MIVSSKLLKIFLYQSCGCYSLCLGTRYHWIPLPLCYRSNKVSISLLWFGHLGMHTLPSWVYTCLKISNTELLTVETFNVCFSILSRFIGIFFQSYQFLDFFFIVVTYTHFTRINPFLVIFGLFLEAKLTLQSLLCLDFKFPIHSLFMCHQGTH